MCTGRCAATEVGIKLKNKAETWWNKSRLVLHTGLSYCFGPRGTTCGGASMAWGQGRGSGAGEGVGMRLWKLHPSNSQANEVENKEKCTNQSLGLYSLIHLRTIATYRGSQG